MNLFVVNKPNYFCSIFNKPCIVSPEIFITNPRDGSEGFVYPTICNVSIRMTAEKKYGLQDWLSGSIFAEKVVRHYFDFLNNVYTGIFIFGFVLLSRSFTKIVEVLSPRS